MLASSGLTAKASTPNPATLHARLALLLIARYSGDRAAEAKQVTHLLNDLHKAKGAGIEAATLAFLKAHVLLGTGDKPGALAAAQLYVDLTNGDVIAHAGAEADMAEIQAWAGDTDAAMATAQRLLGVPAGLSIGRLRFSPA